MRTSSSGRAPRTAVIASATAANRSPGTASRLDQSVPEPFAVLLARGLGELGQWIAADELGFEVGPLPCLGVLGLAATFASAIRRSNSAFPTANWAPAERSMNRAGMSCSSAQRRADPLRAELRERVERRDARLVGRVHEERDRRSHPRILDQADQVARVRRPLDEEGVRLQPLELGQHAPRRTGAVVADAEDGGHGRAARGQSASSRQAL